MRAALRLRLTEARRRGGLWLLGGAAIVVLLTARFGGDTVEGRYGLATDLAAALAYLAAVFFGALPLAIDRERRRAYLPAASPVSPWAWAAGNAMGAAVVGAAAAFLLFVAAGIGTAWSGGIETHAVTRMKGHGTFWLKPGEAAPVGNIPADAREVRLPLRVYVKVENVVGTPDAATIEVDGHSYDGYPDQTLAAPVTPPDVTIRNLSPEFYVGIVRDGMRVLRSERSFLLNALGASLPPALAAAAVAAFGTAAGANLSAAVAALLTVLVLLLASLKGFLLESFANEGKTQAARAHDEAHDLAPHEPGAVHRAAERLVQATLTPLPDLGDLDRTDRVALGEWTATRGSGRAALVLLAALVVAAAAGGLGVQGRRTP
jgi:hypothetical protein